MPNQDRSVTAVSIVPEPRRRLAVAPTTRTADGAADVHSAAQWETAVDYILDDCFFGVGQAVSESKGIEHSALMWWRDRYRAKFLTTIQLFGNRWLGDRHRVIRVCRMLGELAVKYAGDRPTIDIASAARASDDVEHFCARHAIRRARRLGVSADNDDIGLFAGYWCVPGSGEEPRDAAPIARRPEHTDESSADRR